MCAEGKGVMRSFQPVWTDRLMRAAGAQGDVPSLFNPQLQVGVTLEDLTDHQYQWLSRTATMQVGGSTPTNAGRQSGLLLTATNPDIERIVRLRKIYLSATALVSVLWQVLPPGVLPAVSDLALGVPAVRDSRMIIAGGVPTNLVASYGTFVATANGPRIQVAANGPTQVYDLEMTMRPDSGFFVAASAPNLAFAVSVTWDERDITKPEKS